MNKRGGIIGRLMFTLFLMIAAAIAGAYAYAVFDGELAREAAIEDVEEINTIDFETFDRDTVSEYIETAKTDLETAKTRKAVDKIMDDFNEKLFDIQLSEERTKYENLSKQTSETVQEDSNKEESTDAEKSDTDKLENSEDSKDESKGKSIFKFGN